MRGERECSEMKTKLAALDFYDSTLIQIAAKVMDEHPRYSDADLV